MLALEWGALNKGSVGTTGLMCSYLADNLASKAFLLLSTISNTNELYLCSSIFLNHLVKVDDINKLKENQGRELYKLHLPA